MFNVKTKYYEPHKCPDPFANKVKCDECKHWIDKYDAQEVKVNLDKLGTPIGYEKK